MRNLFLAAFAGDEEAERALHLDPSEEVYSMAVAYCASPVTEERAGALSVLAIWGFEGKRHLAERVELAMQSLQDPEIAVVRMAAYVLASVREYGVLDGPRLALFELREHPDARVR